MLFSILIDFSAPYARQSKEQLIGETSVGTCEFSLGCISGRVSISFQPLLAALEVWDKDGLELCLSLGLEPALESGLLLGAWISCAPPGHRGDTE